MKPMATALIAPDKFRGTATAAVAAAALGAAAERAGWTVDLAPVADGGEGLLEALGGTPRSARVLGPLGDPVDAEFRLQPGGRIAVVEMARASGLGLVGGPEGNDPLRASTAGTGALIAAAIGAGAKRVIVGAGGSATTDGGLGAVTALGRGARLAGVTLVVACDVTTRFLDAARVFAPQKGASAAQVELLSRRLTRLAQVYEEDYGVDVRDLAGGGAAGGLGGGLAALGATLTPGFEVVADALDLADRVAAADLVVTGEGLLDGQSFAGKAVGGLVGLALDAGVPILAIVGDVADDAPPPTPGVVVRSLVEAVGRERALGDTEAALAEVLAAHLASIAGELRPQ